MFLIDYGQVAVAGSEQKAFQQNSTNFFRLQTAGALTRDLIQLPMQECNEVGQWTNSH